MHRDDHDDGMHRNLGGHEGGHDEMGHDMDHHDMDHDDDHSDMDHGHIKDMYLCLQAKEMQWNLVSYMGSDENEKREVAKEWRQDIKEMQEEWGCIHEYCGINKYGIHWANWDHDSEHDDHDDQDDDDDNNSKARCFIDSVFKEDQIQVFEDIQYGSAYNQMTEQQQDLMLDAYLPPNSD